VDIKKLLENLAGDYPVGLVDVKLKKIVLVAVNTTLLFLITHTKMTW